ncbi:hypothetical protein [Paenibacillus tritici]|nr:hypothetical protein [Paenibacillus tritici]
MTKYLKRVTFVLMCLVMVLPTLASASPNNENVIVNALEQSSFYDAAGNLTEVVGEPDGTIVVYVNGVLNHSAKTDLTTGTVESTEYIDPTGEKDKQSTEAYGKIEKNINKDKLGMQEKKTIYILDDLIEENVVLDTKEAEKLETSNLFSPATYDPVSTPPTWPYASGYNYRNSYNNTNMQVLAHGYYKNDTPTYSSAQRVSFLRSTTIGVGVSIIVALFGGPVTISIVTGALVACVGAWIIDGVFTKNVDVNVYIQTEWENWLAIVNAKTSYTKQGTEYLRVLNASGPGESLKPLNNGKVGFTFDFFEFLRLASWGQI